MHRKIAPPLLAACILTVGCVPGWTLAPSAPEAPAAAKRHPRPAPRVTLKWLADTAVRLPDLGTHHREITTRSAEAQAFFDQGLRLAYAFNHDEAVRSFAKAAALDPSCAMCFWGAALALGPNYNMPMLRGRTAMAWEALQKALANAPHASPVEQALIGALAKRYAGPRYLTPAEQQPYTEAYAEAMREVAESFPEDDDVQVLFAESLMDVMPWKLWTPEGEPAKVTPDILCALEKVLKRNPEHPGANHYFIHAVEPSPHPERALPSADRLAGLMPGAGHIVHMPAHIYQRVGRYLDASRHNLRAAEVDLAYMKRVKPWGYYPMYLAHNYGFLSYSDSMLGRSEESLWAARLSAESIPPHMLEHMTGMEAMAAEPILAMVRFGRFDELLAEPRPAPRHPIMTAIWLHGHGMALAAKGDLDAARLDLAELTRLGAKIAAEAPAGNNAARDVIDMGAKVLAARIAEKAGSPRALDLWAEAVAREDELGYSEPADWYYPVRHYQGAALLDAERYREAEAVYRADLARNPENGWSLFGLAKALHGQKRMKEAAAVEARFRKAWAHADIELTTTAF